MTKEFLIKSLLPYKENNELCALNGSKCVYLTNDNKKCAIGQYMIPGEWQKYPNGVELLFDKFPEKDIMTDEWIEQNVAPNCAAQMQIYHDNISFYECHPVTYSVIINGAVSQLESMTGFNLNELKF